MNYKDYTFDELLQKIKTLEKDVDYLEDELIDLKLYKEKSTCLDNFEKKKLSARFNNNINQWEILDGEYVISTSRDIRDALSKV